MQLDAAAPPKRSAWHRLRAGVHLLIVSDVRPGRLGAAVALGVLFGCSPFFGFQFILALMIAVPLRLNKLAVAIGTQISTPPLTPFVVFAGANLGELILHHRLLPLTVSAIRAMPPKVLAGQFLLAWTVGGLTLGLLLGAIVGAAVAVGVRIYRVRFGALAEI
ncbi:MAG: DUF2062 domain-containing protein [Gemmatimonadaceae bacterium]